MERDYFNNELYNFETTSWFHLGVLLLAILAFILSIRLLVFVLDNLSHQSKVSGRVRNFFQFILDHIEPFIILLVVGYFISINYLIHIPILALLVLGGYRQIRDYITGKALKYNGALVNGSFISIGEVSGEIGDLRRLGVQVKAKDATHFYSYSRLYDKGFVIHANDTFGGYHNIEVGVSDGTLEVQELVSLVNNSPYSDEFNTTKVQVDKTDSSKVALSVHLRRAAHLDDLKALLRFKGYICE